jgi:hypothetical protein
MSWHGLTEFLVANWGNLASVVGVIVSAGTLAVATKARQAAEAAKAAARRQSLTEVLQDTVRKNEQVGLFLSQRRWDIVWLRAQEIAGVTSVVLTRWPHEFSAGSKDNLLRSQRLSNSIAGVSLVASGEVLTPRAIARMSQAQGRVARLLNTELGESLRGREGRT